MAARIATSGRPFFVQRNGETGSGLVFPGDPGALFDRHTPKTRPDPVSLFLALGEGGVELDLAGSEAHLLTDELARFGRTELAVHAAVFPFDR